MSEPLFLNREFALLSRLVVIFDEILIINCDDMFIYYAIFVQSIYCGYLNFRFKKQIDLKLKAIEHVSDKWMNNMFAKFF